MSTKDEQRKMKNDYLEAKIVAFIHTLKSNSVAVKRIALVIIALIAVLIILAAKSASREAAALNQLNQISLYLHSDIQSKASTIDKNLDLLIKNYSGTEAAYKACYYRALLKYKMKNFKDAFDYFKKAASMDKDLFLHSAAVLGQANCAEEMKQWKTAFTLYERLANNNNLHGFKPTAMMGQARMLIVQNKQKQAIAVLESLKNQKTLYSQKAKKMLSYLKLKNK